MITSVFIIKLAGLAGAVVLRRNDACARDAIAIYAGLYLYSVISGDTPNGDDPGWFLRCTGREFIAIFFLLYFVPKVQLRNWLIGVLGICAGINLVVFSCYVGDWYRTTALVWYPPLIQAAAFLELLILLAARSHVTEYELYQQRRRIHERAFRRGYTSLF